jgi:glycerol-3-phosphate acyltransferase PlsY
MHGSRARPGRTKLFGMVVAGIAAAYLIGSIPFALILSRRWGAHDLHRIGSGNIGAANVLRASGVKAGVLVALLDVAKGAAGVTVAGVLDGQGTLPAVAGFAAIVGHIYPVWLRFRGGKGVATACGAFSMLAPVAVLSVLAIFVAAVWTTKYISVGSVLASAALPLVAFVTDSPAAVVGSASAAAALIVFRHRSNLWRVRLGTERRLGVRA